MTIAAMRVRHGVTVRALRALASVLLVVVVAAGPVAASERADPLDAVVVHAVADGQPTQIVFSAPPSLATRTLTADDVAVNVDGRPREVRVQRLPAVDIDLVVVVDTTGDDTELRGIQAALVELALQLPPGGTMQLVGSDGVISAPEPVPGPAISAIRRLTPGGTGTLDEAVTVARQRLDEGQRERSALVVVGRGLAERLTPIDDRPLDSLTWVVDIGDGRAPLLGPHAGGQTVRVPNPANVLPAMDGIADALRTLHRVDVDGIGPDAERVTLRITAPDMPSTAATLSLTAEGIRPTPVAAAPNAAEDGERAADADAATDPDFGAGADSAADPPAGEDRAEAGAGTAARDTGVAADAATPDDSAWPLLLATVVVMIIVAVVVQAIRRGTPTAPRPTGDQPPMTRPPHGAARTRRMGPIQPPPPITRLTDDTRASLTAAYGALRKLGSAARATGDTVPVELFRLIEARASVAIVGDDRPLPDVLTDLLTDELVAHGPAPDVLIRQSARMMAMAWDGTTSAASGHEVVADLDAVRSAPHDTGPPRPAATVQALDPLLDVALEHPAMLSQPGHVAAIAARATTLTSVMRTLRLAAPVLTVSPWLAAHVDEYRTAARDVADERGRNTWLRLFCEAIAAEAALCTTRVEQLGRLRTRWHLRTDDPTLLGLVDLLLARPVVDEAFIARRLDLTDDSARAVRCQATDRGWLDQRRGQPGVWVAPDVMTIAVRPDDRRSALV